MGALVFGRANSKRPCGIAAAANRMVVWHDGHNSGPRGDYTTMLKADCLGTGTFRRRTARGAKLYHVFRCDVWFRDDDTGRLWTPAYQRSIGMSRRPVHFCNSKTSPYGMLPYGLGVPGCP